MKHRSNNECYLHHVGDVVMYRTINNRSKCFNKREVKMKIERLTKADLKTGMLVLVDAIITSVGVVVGDTIMYTDGEVDRIDQLFECDTYLKKVSNVKSGTQLDRAEMTEANIDNDLFWERKETVKMTMAEINKLVGKNVEIVE